MSALLMDDVLKPAMLTTNDTINQILQQIAPLSDDRLLQLADCRKLSTLIDHLLKASKQHSRPDLSRGCLGTTGQA